MPHSRLSLLAVFFAMMEAEVLPSVETRQACLHPCITLLLPLFVSLLCFFNFEPLLQSFRKVEKGIHLLTFDCRVISTIIANQKRGPDFRKLARKDKKALRHVCFCTISFHFHVRMAKNSGINMK